jgi:protein required for attachment to host cells
MHKTPRTHYLIADGARARMVTRKPGEQDLSTLTEIAAEREHAHAREGGAVFQRMGPGRSTPGEGSEVINRKRADFAGELAAMLGKEADKGAFDRLVLVAPARMLGLLQDRLPPSAKAKVTGTLARDLTKTPVHDLHRWLHEL